MLYPAFGVMKPEELVFILANFRKAWDSRAVGRRGRCCEAWSQFSSGPMEMLESELHRCIPCMTRGAKDSAVSQFDSGARIAPCSPLIPFGIRMAA
jgi:hypothetical protein